jgi:hypothetical protein
LEIRNRPTEEREAIEFGVCVVLEDDLCDSGADKSSRLLEDIVSKRECALLLGGQARRSTDLYRCQL